MVGDEWAELLRGVIHIEGVKESIYREMGEGAKDGDLKQLLESLAESKRRHADVFSSLLDEESVEGASVAEKATSIDPLAKKASWLITNLERKKEIAPTIESKMLAIEFLQRTEEECLGFHNSLKDAISGPVGKEFEKVIVEEKKEVENLRQLVLRTLSSL